jgi:tetratricopeptide (TPR) repeat protein
MSRAAGESPAPAAARMNPLAALGLLAAATLAAYWPVLGAGFIWDDEGHVTRPDLRSLAGLGRIWFHFGATQQYYPVLHSAFWLEHRLWGGAPLGYHLCNLALHAAAAGLFLCVLRRLAVPGALVASLLFALHPVGVETAAWISEQKNTLSAVFYLLSTLAYLRFDERREGRWYLAALGLFLLALLSKTVTATLPAALLVVFWWRRGRLEWKRDVGPLVPWFALAAAGGLTTAWVERSYIGARGAHFDLSLVQRGLVAGHALWFYLGKVLWPADLIFIYPRWVVDPRSLILWAYPAAALAVLAGLFLLRRRTRAPLAAALLFAGTLFPALGFFNVYPFLYSFVADHFQYLADLGLFALAGAAAAAAWRRARGAARAALGALVAAVLLTLGVLTSRQARTYHDLETLFQTTVDRNPGSWLAHGNLGVIMAGTGRLPQAMAHYEAALRLNPEIPQTYNNLGNAWTLQRRWPEAFAAYARALELWPEFVEARFDWATALSQAGRLDEAAAAFAQALRQRPDYPEAEFGLANAEANRGRLAAALPHYQAAIRQRPGYAEAHANLGLALLTLGRPGPALAELAEALRLRPDYAEAHAYLGLALAQGGRLADAAAQFREALRLDPANAEVHYQLGLVLRAQGDAAGAAAEFARSGSPAPEAAR